MPFLKSILSLKKIFVIPLFLITSLIYLFFFGVSTSPDSLSYITGDKVRTAGYPIIIQIFKMIFMDNGLLYLAYSQIFLWLYSSFYFSNEISKVFNLSNFFTVFFWLIMCIPLNPLDQFGNSILTESFSFIGLIWFLIFLFRTFQKDILSEYLILILILVLMQLIRPQMQFLSFFLIIISFFLFFIKKKEKAWFYIVCAFLSFLFSSNINKAYHYFKHDRFDSIPFTGIQIINLPLFTISKENITKINNISNKRDILAMKEKLIKNDPYNNQEIFEPSRPINNFAASYNSIIGGAVYKVLHENYPEFTSYRNDNKLIELTKEIIFICLKYQPISLIAAYTNNVVHLGFAGWIWFLLITSILFVCLYYFLKLKTKRLFILLSLFTVHYCNIILVSILEPVIWRYSFYTDLPLTVIIVALISSTLLYSTEK